MKKKRRLKLFRECGILLLTLIYISPVYYFIINAFKEPKDISLYPFTITPKMFTVRNIVAAFERVRYLPSLKYTFMITAISLILLVFLCSMGSFALARIKSRFFKIYYIIIVGAMVLPFTISLIPLIITLKDMGLIRTIWAPISVQVAWNAPFALFLYTGFMRGLPDELEEAAYLDGCGMFKVYTSIFFPLLKPVTATCIIVIGLGIWNDFLVSYVTLNPAHQPTLQVGLYNFCGKYLKEYNLTFAGMLIVSTPVVITFLFLQKYFIKGIATGAVKG